MKAAGEFLCDIVLLGAVALSAWLFPRTTIAIEGVCGLGTLALFIVERQMR